jgi:hypothetical protein
MFALVQGKGREATAHRYDVVESGHATMFTDRIPPAIVLEALTRELSALARACEQRGPR